MKAYNLSLRGLPDHDQGLAWDVFENSEECGGEILEGGGDLMTLGRWHRALHQPQLNLVQVLDLGREGRRPGTHLQVLYYLVDNSFLL